MKLNLLTRIASVSALTLGLSVSAMANTYSVQSSSNLGDAAAACYIDTPAWDEATANRCGTSTLAISGDSTAVFSVIGINQSSGQFSIQYLDNTCDSIMNTSQEGKVCLRAISPGEKLKQRVQVTDNNTGQSVVLYALANYRVL
ncbi:MAG: hypothetical protein HUJ16_08190 [Kangiella sp.]|nr:hypothetical protein [Kangiella sp.]